MVQRLKGAAFSVHDISVLFAAGPMVAALGDLTHGFLCQGVPLYKASLYEDRVKEGYTLVSVAIRDDDEMTYAKEIFTKAGGREISTSEEPVHLYRPTTTPHLAQPSEASLGFA